MKQLVIIGAGGFAREVYYHSQLTNEYNLEWQIKGFLDGDIKLSDEEYKKLPENIPVLGNVDNYEIEDNDVFTCAIGTPELRKKLIAKFINIISPSTTIFPTAKVGQGVIIGLNNGIGPEVEIGDFSIINNVTFIGHDTKVGKYTSIMSHVEIGGGVKIGEEVFISSGVTIIPKSKIGDGAAVGAGSVVLRKVKAGAKVFGNPAMEF